MNFIVTFSGVQKSKPTGNLEENVIFVKMHSFDTKKIKNNFNQLFPPFSRIPGSVLVLVLSKILFFQIPLNYIPINWKFNADFKKV